MKKLLVYLRDYRKESILGPLFKMLEAAFELLVPLVMAAMIDHGIAQRDTGYLVRMGLLLVGLGALGLTSSATAQYFAAKAATGFGLQVRHALFEHIQSLSYAELDTLGASTLTTRMTSDMNQAQNGVNMTLRLLLRSPFIVFGAMAMAFTINTPAALTFAVAIPVLSVVVFGIILWCIPLYQKVQARLDRVLVSTRESLTGARVLRAFCKEEEQMGEFSARNAELTRLQKYVGRISALMNPLTYVIINLAILWLIWTGAWQVEAGILTQGALVALYNYMSQILVELIKLANLIVTITRAVACGNRIQAVLDIQPSQRWAAEAPQAVPGAAAIELNGVGLRYPGAAETALTGVTLSIPRGQTVGIIGGTGSGKTSLVNLIPRFYDATDGAVKVNGADVKDYPKDDLRQRIGVVPQQAALFQGTLRENLRWGRADATDADLWEALAVAQAADVAQDKGGLDFAVEPNGRNLSGGQRQRLTLARALVRKPEILILDDSASALDYATDAALRRAIRELPDKPTVLIVSQRAASIQHADCIVVLDDGNVVGVGNSETLLQTCDVYREIYESQFPREEAVTDARA
ncbi:MAG TPA: ABC transporter ATP-binding protein [Candidatus Limiplasma sp.]|nr:ABC transporter ATP-binding protein [Candidatus Limiplasma sp.]HPS80717.1 ABC transporter ATP-binding protein [Candidatus Limiplasma sp.]